MKTFTSCVVLFLTLFIFGCTTTSKQDDINPSITIDNITETYETIFFTNFQDENAAKFTYFTGMSLIKENGTAFIVGNKDNGSMQRQYTLTRGSEAFIKFRTIDSSSLNFMLTKKGYKEKGFRTIGLAFHDGNSMLVFEMHGENPVSSIQPWRNTGYAQGKIYGLLVSIDESGFLSFTIVSQNEKPVKYTYKKPIEDEMWSFALGVTGKLEVFEYREMK